MADSLLPASSVFLVLYLVLFCILVWLFATRRVHWRSRFTWIGSHVTLRLAAQACGVAYSQLGLRQYGVLIAYLVLGAEGYFSLILCCLRSLIAWENEQFGESWLEPKRAKGVRYLQYLRENPMQYANIVHWLLIAGNAIYIVGGSVLANQHPTKSSVTLGHALRVTGSCCYLASEQVVFAFTVRDYILLRRRPHVNGSYIWILLFSWIPLTIRGIFSVAASEIHAINLASSAVFAANGVPKTLVVVEYLLGVTQEWIVCASLISTYFIGRKYAIYTNEHQPQNHSGSVHHESEQMSSRDEPVPESKTA